MKQSEHTFWQFLKTKDVPLTDISSVKMRDEKCACGCGMSFRVSDNSTQAYRSKFCPIVKGWAENTYYRNSTRSVGLKKKHKDPVSLMPGQIFEVVKMTEKGKSQKEIAQALNINIRTVNVYLSKARKIAICTLALVGAA